MKLKNYYQDGLLVTFIIIGSVMFIAGIAIRIHNRSMSTNRSNVVGGQINKGANTPPVAVKSEIPTVIAKVTSASYDTWGTYTSHTEKASFKYPSSWIKTGAPSFTDRDSDPTVDGVTLTSPSGQIKLSWASEIQITTQRCNSSLSLGLSGSCPKVTYLSQTTIKTSDPQLFVSATLVTQDGKNYTPWLGVTSFRRTTDDNSAYGAYNGLYNNCSDVVFSTGSVSMTGPELSQDAAKKWFDSPEAKQALLILESLKYPGSA